MTAHTCGAVGGVAGTWGRPFLIASIFSVMEEARSSCVGVAGSFPGWETEGAGEAGKDLGGGGVATEGLLGTGDLCRVSGGRDLSFIWLGTCLCSWRISLFNSGVQSCQEIRYLVGLMPSGIPEWEASDSQ